MPEFWLGMMLLIVFSVGVFGLPGLFPVGGISHRASTRPVPPGWLDVLWHLALPCLTLVAHLPRRLRARDARLA